MEQVEDTIDAGAFMTRVEQLIDEGRPGAARPLLTAARGLTPPSSGLSVLAARLALSDGRLDAAQAELDRALDTDPDHSGLRKCRAELRRQLGDLEGAARDAAEAVILSRHDPEAKALLGMALLEHRPRRGRRGLPERSGGIARPKMSHIGKHWHRRSSPSGDLDASDDNVLLDGIAIVPGATRRRATPRFCCASVAATSSRRNVWPSKRVIDGVADATTYGLKGHASSSLGRHDEAAQAYNEALKLAPGDAHVRHLAVTSRQPRSAARMTMCSEPCSTVTRTGSNRI
jgi:tetratricopeptide (TPR) repeat protein